VGFLALDPLEQMMEEARSLLDKLENALASVGTDKFLVTPDNPPNLDVALSTRASETTLSSVLSKLDALDNALASIGTDELRVISV